MKNQTMGWRKTDITLLCLASAMIIFSVIAACILLEHTYTVPAAEPADNIITCTPTDVYVPDSVDEMLRNQAENIVSAMSDELKVGQLLLIRSNGISGEEFAGLIQRCNAGGVVLFGEDIDGRSGESMTAYVQNLQSAAGGKLLVCVDEEGGTVVRLSGNEELRSERFRSPQEIYSSGGMEAVRRDTAEKCLFLQQYGVNVNFAPVADVVTSRRGFLYRRAFGAGAEKTAEYVREVVTVMEEYGMGNTIKHFPGYGNASGDTHNGLVVVDTPEAEIRNYELLPFIAGISAGADSVMVTHTVLSAIDPLKPATLSPAVISILRDDLGFGGVIISDAMDMGAISEYTGGEDACVAGFLAGLDMLCAPEDAETAYEALLGAVKNGTVPQERLNESVVRIIMWKISLGLYETDG